MLVDYYDKTRKIQAFINVIVFLAYSCLVFGNYPKMFEIIGDMLEAKECVGADYFYYVTTVPLPGILLFIKALMM